MRPSRFSCSHHSSSGRRSPNFWKKAFISESSDWVDIHHCYFAVGLAAVGASLFVATSENMLWWLDLHGLRQP